MVKAYKYLNLIFFILMIVVNFLANLLPLGIGKTGVISEKYQNLFTPAPITFSIWGVIYILTAIFIVYQLGCIEDKTVAKCFVELIGPWFVISCIMNMGWLFSWHYDKIILSMILMLGLLFSLIMLTTRFSSSFIARTCRDTLGNFFAKVSLYAFDIYLGWITAATIANASVLLVKLQWNRFGMSSVLWTIIVLLVGALLGILFITTSQKYLSAAAIIWAYCGILIKHISQAGFAGKYPVIIVVTILCIVAILTAGAIKCILNVKTS